jgi:DNA polymerase IV
MTTKLHNCRKIIHVDMDAFYASVEQRDNLSLKGKAVIVGGEPDSRGVVSTCSYEAREYGIHSAMSSAKAYKLCPAAIFITPKFSKYKKASQQIRNIFKTYTDLIEPLSLDEAFLDVTINKLNNPSATMIAKKILAQIFAETQLTASAGVSYNKFLAKVTSDINKPNGVAVITPSEAISFIEKLPIRKFFGIGKVTEEKMLKMNIKNGADLKKYSKIQLVQQFGKFGEYYYDIVRGIDNRPVNPARIRKSVGKEITLSHDTDDIQKMLTHLEKLAVEVNEILIKYDISGKTITLKIKYHDFKLITRSLTLPFYLKHSSNTIMRHVTGLLKKTNADKQKIRLLGITISNLDNNIPEYIQTVFPFYEKMQ